MLAVLCALGSALMYASASVLQQRYAAVQPLDQSLKLSLLARLVRDPGWLLGLGFDVAAYGLQFLALGHGPLILVQPLLVCGLLFALPIGAAWAGRTLHRRDWGAAVLVCAGLSAFLLVASPDQGHDDVRPVIWVLLLASASAAVFVLLASSRGRAPWRRAVLLSGAAGIVYGVTAALTKTCAHLLGRSFIGLLGSWQPYVLLGAGIGGMVIAQSAFQVGSLDSSLPTMSVVDPIVSIVIGTAAFGEHIATGPADILAEVIALMAMAVGVFLLALPDSDRFLRHRLPPSG